MPILLFLRPAWKRGISENEIMKLYTHKLLAVSHHDTIRVCYKICDLLRESSDEVLTRLALQSVRSLMKMIELVGRVSSRYVKTGITGTMNLHTDSIDKII